VLELALGMARLESRSAPGLVRRGRAYAAPERRAESGTPIAEELDVWSLVARPLAITAIATTVVGCAPPIRSTATRPPTPAELTALWEDVEPGSRDLLHGVGGRELAPDPEAVYEILERDLRGYSTTFDVRDPSGREWSVKIGPEAQSEVTASRLAWAIGFRQLPSYYLSRWRWRWPDRNLEGSEGAGRFRPKVDAFDPEGEWSWHQNPFVGTRAYRGLLVLMAILNSTDLKDENNALVYDRRGSRERVRYVVKDLGATLGTTGSHNPARNDVEAFERHPFLLGTSSDGRVRIAFRGRHRELFAGLTPEDVRWTCARLSRLSDDQWRDAFLAAGQRPEVTARFIARLKQKVSEGLALGRSTRGDDP
jgi:hypothetical protein